MIAVKGCFKLKLDNSPGKMIGLKCHSGIVKVIVRSESPLLDNLTFIIEFSAEFNYETIVKQRFFFTNSENLCISSFIIHFHPSDNQ